MAKLKVLIACCFACYAMPLFAALQSAAFFYGQHPPLDQLQAYDVAVLDPQSSIQPAFSRLQGTQLLAYVSVGEAANSATYRADIKPAWILAQNKTWHSVILNQANPEWQTFFLDHIIAPLWNKGFKGFFLDTLDAYQAANLSDADKKAQQQGLITLIKKIHERYPSATIILNRGFEIIPAVAHDINAVVAESLFQSWNQTKHAYEAVSKENSQYLRTELDQVKSRNIPVIVIDYVNPNQPALAKQTAIRIRQLGFIPYVTDGLLQHMGTNDLTPVQRKLLVIYTLPNEKTTVFNPEAFTMVAMPVEYLGYLPVFQNAKQAYPRLVSKQDYAGIIVLTNSLTPIQQKALYQFLVTAKGLNIPILFLSNFGFDNKPDWLNTFDISIPDYAYQNKVQLSIKKTNANYIGYETKPPVNQFDFEFYHANHANVLLQLQSNHGQTEDAVAITAWGGYAVDPYVIVTLPNTVGLWVINPMKLIADALRLKQIPIPDITTENGTRLAFAHIDGDGFLNPPQFNPHSNSAIELKKEILDKYQVPTAFSVVTADVASNGLYPKLAGEIQKISKSIFQLPWIESASHTFSHPFDWIKVKTAAKNGVYNLPVPNYRYNETVEIKHSVAFIQKYLAPQSTKPTIMLWSGYANLDKTGLEILANNHLIGMNGGETVITKANPYLSLITPQGLMVGKHYQVFAPIGNEEYYTNGWSQPLYGFRRVIETFELTEKPMRLKPVDIYYHIYSASTEASLNALKTVYAWALAQPLNWIYPYEYVEKALEARYVSLFEDGTGWTIKTQGNIREIRYDVRLGYPDLIKSSNIIGFNQANDMIYAHLSKNTSTHLVFTKTLPTSPYLVSVNGEVIEYRVNNKTIQFALKANQPLRFTLSHPDTCHLSAKNTWMNADIPGKKVADHLFEYHLNDRESHELTLDC